MVLSLLVLSAAMAKTMHKISVAIKILPEKSDLKLKKNKDPCACVTYFARYGDVGIYFDAFFQMLWNKSQEAV